VIITDVGGVAGHMTDQRLEIDHVSKRYGDVVALREITFDVRAGELFGFVGSNGAGTGAAGGAISVLGAIGILAALPLIRTPHRDTTPPLLSPVTRNR
jgi:ABC-type microcin C transport system duplicated ATPase subunit YejF